MQISTVNFLNLNKEFRIDAEYYRANVLDKINILDRRNNATLDKIVTFIVGPFGSTVKADNYVSKSNHRYIRNKDINNFTINELEPAYIPNTIYNSLPQFHIKEKDLLITVVGTLGKVALAQEKDSNSIFSCKSTVLRSTAINPYYLLTYLNSPTGQIFVNRGTRGAIQEGLNLSDLKEIRVFLPNELFQLTIEKAIAKAFFLINSSQNIYQEAEHQIVKELNLLSWKPHHQLSYVKNFSDSQESNRIDAEYFQPKYDEIIETIKNYKGGLEKLGNLISIKKSIEPGSNEYLDEGIPFIRVSNLSKFEISFDSPKYISERLYFELKQHQPVKNEILFSKDATPGIAYLLIDEPEQMIVSGGILRLKTKNHKINPEYLTIVLNSIIVQQQMLRDAGGSVIKHWRPDQIKDVMIPILDYETQNEIKNKFIESFHYRKKSKLLIELAKQAVELAIEEDETKAIAFINKKLASLNINIE